MFKDLLSRFERLFITDLSYGNPRYQLIPYVSCDGFTESILSFQQFLQGLSLTDEGYLVKANAPFLLRARFSLESRSSSLEKLLFDVENNITSEKKIPAELNFSGSKGKVIDHLSFDGRAFYFVREKNDFYERLRQEM